MHLVYKIIKDFWQTAFLTWLILLILEMFKAGMVQRFINLEYYFYFLFLFYLAILFIKEKI